jgi:DNA-binding NarL/FixJ family response regulator
MIRLVFCQNCNSSNCSVENLRDGDEELLFWLAQGKSNQEISELIFLSKGRVKNNVTEVLGRYGCENRTQLAMFFGRNYPHL